MQSSAAVTLRAFLMLACVVGIPAFALSGTSWSELVKKFQNIQVPAILNLASASSSATSDEAPRLPLPKLAEMSPKPSPAVNHTSRPEANFAANTQIPPGIHEIENKLQQFGATYYVLEAWGSDEQLYRFYCKMAVGGNADFTHCFEATDADPLQAMLHVLKQVEAWREGEGLPKAPTSA